MNRAGRPLIALTVLVGISVPALAQKPLPSIQFVIPGLQKTPPAQNAGTPTPQRFGMAAQPQSFWWNDPDMIEALGLEEAQRKKMDDVMAGVAEKITELMHKQNIEREKFDTALRERDWENARKAATEWETAFAQSWGYQNRTKLEVLMNLTQPQHTKLFADYQDILQRPWAGGGKRLHYEGGPRSTGASSSETPPPTNPIPQTPPE